MSRDLEGRHAVVTGGGRGIGRAIALRLSAAGAQVTLMGRNLESLQQVGREIGAANSRCIGIDVADPGAVDHAFDQAIGEAGDISILVNNAGIAPSAPFTKMTLDHWRQVVDTNLTGVFACTRAAIESLLRCDRARIISIASTSGLKGYPYVAAYCAAKHGVVGLTRALAAELSARDITVNAVCPGFTDTDLVSGAISNITEKTGRKQEDALQELVRTNPQGRLIDPDEVAATVMWLCSADAGSITGQSIVVAGGEVT